MQQKVLSFDDPVRQEIWNTIRALNDAWTCGNPDDLKNYFHSRMVAFTASDCFYRKGQHSCLNGWKGFAQMAEIHSWVENDPIIEVYGESAVVAYYYDMSCTINGMPYQFTGRDMFFLVRESGLWLVAGDHFSSYPDV